jgi:hypothetical protein
MHMRMGARGGEDSAAPGRGAEPGAPAPADEQAPQTSAELREEDRKLRRLQLMIDVVMSVIAQDRTLSVEDASQMVADTRVAALAMFPDKAQVFDWVYRPRLQRLMRERFRMQ